MAIEAKNLVKEYNKRRVVDGVSLQVDPGEVVGLLGPNGAGENHDLLYDRRPRAAEKRYHHHWRAGCHQPPHAYAGQVWRLLPGAGAFGFSPLDSGG